jgi:hypothetical protein
MKSDIREIVVLTPFSISTATRSPLPGVLL